MSDETNHARLEELSRLDTLTDAEMGELIRLKPAGTFKEFPNILTIGVVDLPQAVADLKEGKERAKHAYDSCYVEVISLRLQHIDFWLRLFWVARNRDGKIFEASDKRTFGVLVTDCAKLGFDTTFVERMRSFNASRVDVIHKYLLGAIRYEDLRAVCDSHFGLDREVGEYVRRETGVPWQV